MHDWILNIHDAVVDRLHGPMKFRFIMQPLLAAIFAVKAGLADGRAGRPAFLWSIFTNREGRAALVKDGWKDIAKVFTMATIMDLVYQFIVMKRVFPLRALLVAAVLCFVPYILLRGPVSRLTSRRGA